MERNLVPLGLTALVAAAFCGSLLANPSDNPPSITPVQAQARLVEGNRRFVIGKPARPNQDPSRRAALAKVQKPFATVLSCSDSRVPVEIILDQGIGDVFVVRVAGNVADTDEVGTVEYGVGHLGTPLLVVLGHTGCGAVTAVLEGAEVHGSIPQLVDNIAPAVSKARAANPAASELLREAIRANIWTSVEDLFLRSAEIRGRVKAGRLAVVGALYDLESGGVAWLGQHPEQARLLEGRSRPADVTRAEPAPRLQPKS